MNMTVNHNYVACDKWRVATSLPNSLLRNRHNTVCIDHRVGLRHSNATMYTKWRQYCNNDVDCISAIWRSVLYCTEAIISDRVKHRFREANGEHYKLWPETR